MTTKIIPISQDNKGRFNRREITITEERLGFEGEVIVGTTDTKKEVFIKVLFDNTIGIRYSNDDFKIGYRYCSSLGWKNHYILTNNEILSITK